MPLTRRFPTAGQRSPSFSAQVCSFQLRARLFGMCRAHHYRLVFGLSWCRLAFNGTHYFCPFHTLADNYLRLFLVFLSTTSSILGFSRGVPFQLIFSYRSLWRSARAQETISKILTQRLRYAKTYILRGLFDFYFILFVLNVALPLLPQHPWQEQSRITECLQKAWLGERQHVWWV